MCQASPPERAWKHALPRLPTGLPGPVDLFVTRGRRFGNRHPLFWRALARRRLLVLLQEVETELFRRILGVREQRHRFIVRDHPTVVRRHLDLEVVGGKLVRIAQGFLDLDQIEHELVVGVDADHGREMRDLNPLLLLHDLRDDVALDALAQGNPDPVRRALIALVPFFALLFFAHKVTSFTAGRALQLTAARARKGCPRTGSWRSRKTPRSSPLEPLAPTRWAQALEPP